MKTSIFTLIDAKMLINMIRNGTKPNLLSSQWSLFVVFNLVFATLNLCFFVLQVVYNGKELNHPFGISHYRNYIFWTEYMNASVFQLELSTGDVTLLRSERPPLFGLRVYDAQSQQGELIWMCFGASAAALLLVLMKCARSRKTLSELCSWALRWPKHNL